MSFFSGVLKFIPDVPKSSTPAPKKPRKPVVRAPRLVRPKSKDPINDHPGTLYDLQDPSVKVGELELPRAGRVILAFGMSKAGKSTAMRSLLKSYSLEDHFVFGLVISKTAGFAANNDWACFPKADVKLPSEELILKHIRDLQEMANAGVDIPPNVIVIDDCTGVLGSSRTISEEFTNFIPNCRHTNTTLIVSTHQYAGAATMFRNNADYVFIYMSNDSDNDKALHKSFGKYLPKPLNKFKNYEDWAPEHMRNHRALLFIADISNPRYYWYLSDNIAKTGWRLYPS
jgi:hypothetical protein